MTEQELQLEKEKALREQMMWRWLRHHPSFLPIDANCKMVDDFLAENNLGFTEQNLDLAFQALEGQLAKQSVAKSVPAAPATPAQTPEDGLDALYPLPAGWKKIYTPQDVHDLSGDDYKRMYHSSKGDMFRKRVNEIMRRYNVQGRR